MGLISVWTCLISTGFSCSIEWLKLTSRQTETLIFIFLSTLLIYFDEHFCIY